MFDQPENRRFFLNTLGSVSLSGVVHGALAGAATDADAAAPPADLPGDLRPVQADIGSLFPEIERLAATADDPYSFVGDRFRSLEDFKAAAREKVLECFGDRPAKVDPRPEVVDRADLGYCIREKVVFSTTPHFRVPAYVLIPKKAQRPLPAILDLHSHGGMFLFGKEKVVDLGRNHPVMVAYHQRNYGGRPTATTLVRRGYLVISIDAFMFGERRLIMDEDLKYGWERSKYSVEEAAYLNGKCRAKESTLAKALILAGMTWPGIVTWDDMRTVDYLMTRPEVDPQRIGCVGVSLGGHRSLYLAGMDERIAAACVVGFLSTVRPMIRRHIDTHSWVHFVPGLHRYLDMPDVASMMAPKPLLVQQCREDGLFPLVGMQEAIRKIAEVYRKAGTPEQFTGRFYPGGHRFDQQMQDDAFDWLDRQLQR